MDVWEGAGWGLGEARDVLTNDSLWCAVDLYNPLDALVVIRPKRDGSRPTTQRTRTRLVEGRRGVDDRCPRTVPLWVRMRAMRGDA
jgi:hypothetical protein